MSMKSHSARKFAIAGVAAAAAIGASASGAQAASLTLKYSCTYPLIGAQPLSVAINASLPTSVKVNTATPKYTVKAVATAGGSTHDGLTTVGAKTVEGTATATASIDDAGTKIPVTVPTTVAKYTVPAGSGPLTLNASGSTPSIKFTKVGTAKVSVTSLKMNLTARNSSGKPVQLGKTTDSDKSKDTFDVTCALSPTTQSTTLASIKVTS